MLFYINQIAYAAPLPPYDFLFGLYRGAKLPPFQAVPLHGLATLTYEQERADGVCFHTLRLEGSLCTNLDPAAIQSAPRAWIVRTVEGSYYLLGDSATPFPSALLAFTSSAQPREGVKYSLQLSLRTDRNPLILVPRQFTPDIEL